MLENAVILLIISIILYFYWFYKRAFMFFKKRNIPYIEPRLIFGNVKEAVFLRKRLTDIYIDIYRELEPHKIVGIYHFHKPTFMIRDPELLKSILIRDFAHFPNRNIPSNSEEEPLTMNLLNAKGELWRNLRIKLTPTLSSGKMKMMLPLIKVCGENLVKFLEKLNPEDDIDMKDLCSRFTTDVTGTCFFGLETNTLKNPDSEFWRVGKELTKTRLQIMIRVFVPNISPKIIKYFNLHVFDRKLETFFFPLVKNTIRYREDNKITRNDFLDILIGLKNNNKNKFQAENDGKDLKKLLTEIGNKNIKSNLEMTNDLLVAQVFVFFFAGFETSSIGLSFLLLELALNPDIQNKVRTEINTILENNGNELTYEVMKKMKFADMVIAEALRKHPPGGLLIRQCEKNYNVPGTNVQIQKNENLIVPIHALHMDEKYFEKPNEFYPEHFTEEAIASRPHFSYLPFGEGPRMCIAARFATLEIKIALIYVLRSFSFSVSPKMILPIKYSGDTGNLAAEGGIWLNCKKI